MIKNVCTVVLCDDEPAVIKELEDTIEWDRLGAEVIGIARNGREALDLVLEKKPDVAVIDINMPEMQGLEMIRRVRNGNEKTDFIILSGYGNFQFAKEAIRDGVSAYLLKPLNVNEFYEEFMRILERRSQKRNDTYGTIQLKKEVYDNFFHNILDGKILEQSAVSIFMKSEDIPVSDTSSFAIVLSYDSEHRPDALLYDRILHVLSGALTGQRFYFLRYDETKIVGIFNAGQESSFTIGENLLDIFNQNALPLPYIGIGDTVTSIIALQYSFMRADIDYVPDLRRKCPAFYLQYDLYGSAEDAAF